MNLQPLIECVLFVMVLSLFSFLALWFGTLKKLSLGRFIVDGKQNDVQTNLRDLLQKKEAKNIILDVKNGKISIFGITKIVDKPTFKFYGNVIDFYFKNLSDNKTEIVIVAHRTITASASYTKSQWQQFGYDGAKIFEIMTALGAC